MNFLRYIKRTKLPLQKQKKAFALVLALALMGFMVLLIVSLATMVGMQVKLSKQSINSFKAKQAAKYSAYEALGRIQSTLGPDQRITANASILSDSIHSSIEQLDTDATFNWWQTPMRITRRDAEDISGAIAPNKYWVGVWHSKHGYHPEKQLRGESRGNYTRAVMDRAITWLVSGNGFSTEDETLNGTQSASVEYRPDRALQDGKFARMVTKNSFEGSTGGNDPNNDVLAPIVELPQDSDDSMLERNSATQTRIAWWVSDEGQKASLNAIADYDMKRHADSIKYRVQSLPFYSGVQGLTIGDGGGKMYNVNLDDDGASDSSVMIARNANALEQLDVLAASEGIVPSKRLFHSATTNVKGLLVNVRDGGLKKDLSLGLIQIDGKDDKHAKTTNEPIKEMPDYFPRPYGVSGYWTKTTAYPIRWLSSDSDWRNNRRKYKPELDDKKYNGNREFAGHIFGPQMFTREEENELNKHPKQSFGKQSTNQDWCSIYCDTMLWKDPGGALWDQLRSYYNLRSPDNPDNSTISSRVQTDDRYGAKPVVKRFQVHYVPLLVDYGNNKYGLRFHIIPMLVLWNPYDTKIGEDTYYAIRVSSRDFKEFHNPVGTYRFAIGYKSGRYFQCLRDLLTERMRLPASNSVPSIDFLQRNGFSATRRGFINNGESNYCYAKGVDDPYFDSVTGNTEGTAGNWGSLGSHGYKMSKTIGFYRTVTELTNDQRPWLPLGYGSIAQYKTEKILAVSSKLSINYRNWAQRTNWTTIFPNYSKRDPSREGNVCYYGDLRDWEEIIAVEENMTKVYDYGSSKAADRYSKFNRYGRVAKIPLYLNNLYASVSHGGFNARVQGSHGNYAFYGQRGIDAINVNKTFNDATMGQMMQTADLHFLAHDPTGIDAGATKVFAMKRPTNYLGNSKASRGQSLANNLNNGPNGIIEDKNLSGGRISPYENNDALMLPIGEANGGTLGGCFYLDVPHPELEHYAKHESDNRPTIAAFVANGGETDGTEKLDNPYILFDLQDLKNANIHDFGGLSTSSLSINDIYVDMQDVSVFPNMDINGQRITPYLMDISMTPMAYGLSRIATPYSTVNGNAVDTYYELQLAIWIYRKEGMTFTEMSPNKSKTTTGHYPDYVPLLAHFKGTRTFLGAKYPSFPDPSMVYNDNDNSSDYDSGQRFNNWHVPGYMPVKGSPAVSISDSGATDFNKVISLTPPIQFYFQLDKDFLSTAAGGTGNKGLVSAQGQLLIDKIDENKNNLDGINERLRLLFNGRHFLNWLPLNPRRHSANCWIWNPTRVSGDIKNIVGDMLPAARNFRTVLTSGDVNADSYANKLHNLIQSDSKYIPYGYIFGQPYADDDGPSETGAKPIYNRRMFVNGSFMATHFVSDNNAQEINDSDPQFKRAREWGLAVKNAVATSMVYYSKEDGTRSPGSGVSQMGYKIPSSKDDTCYVGLSQKVGTDVNAMSHILREDEVVHNIANLSGAHLNFGAGKWESTSDWHSKGPPFPMAADSERPWNYSYGLLPPESSMVDLAIGNSLAPSRVCPEYTYQVQWLDYSSSVSNYYHTAATLTGMNGTFGTRELDEDKGIAYDLSWHYNDALWDEYFFSTLPYRQKEETTTYNVGGGIAMPQNPRIQYVCKDHDDDVLKMADMKYSKEISDKQFDENAGKLWVNGAFNINSTSVDAWKAVLATYYGQTIEGYRGSPSDNRSSAPFHRWQAPLDSNKKATSNTNLSQEETIFTGYRALSDSELEELAVSIVEHVKDRGPFYSMSDFVNRLAANYSAEEKYFYKRAGEDHLLALTNQRQRIDHKDLASMYESGGETYRVGHSQKGVLQAAIDATSINGELHKDYIIGGDVPSLNQSWQNNIIYSYFKEEKKVWENWRAIVGPSATAAPTYLMQQDILSRLGSFLTVRSDTFKIRAYGEIRNPVSGVVESKAWCEMTVQRTPEYMDNSDFGNAPADVYGREKELGYQPGLGEYNLIMNETNGGLTKLNQALGRRFKVVSFRWLSDSEI